MTEVDSRVKDLITSLQGAETVAPQWAVIREWTEARDVARLRETAFALTERAFSDAPKWTVDSAVDYLIRQLALTPDRDFALVVRDVARRRDPRYLASLVASGQPFAVLRELIAAADTHDEEFLACLVQELVLRVEQLDLEPFTSFRKRLEQRGHPLSWLPLQLTEIEEGLTFPQYSECGQAFEIPFGPMTETGQQGTTALVPRIEREITSQADVQLISTAVGNWLDESNGKAEARVFEVGSGTGSLPLTEALAATGLACLAESSSAGSEETSATRAFEIVFSAASTGGAYSHGRRGAYGRLEAWKTIAGLAGVGPDQPFERVTAATEGMRWFRFDAEAPWFYGVAWDFGIAAQRADTRRLAVLAATDTD